jgi:hypothetical protein
LTDPAFVTNAPLHTPLSCTYVLLLANHNSWTSDVLLADRCVLCSFEAVKEVGSERAVKVQLEPGYYGRDYSYGITEAVELKGKDDSWEERDRWHENILRRFRSRQDVILELLEDLLDCWASQQCHHL